MAHLRLRKFNTRDVYGPQALDNDVCMVVRAGRHIFLRGQTGFDLNNVLHGAGDPAAQADQAMKNVKVLLCGMLAPPTMGSDYSRDYINAFPDLADEHGVEFLPFLLDGVATKRELNQADGIHPNAEGTRIMTDNIYSALKPLLTKE